MKQFMKNQKTIGLIDGHKYGQIYVGNTGIMIYTNDKRKLFVPFRNLEKITKIYEGYILSKSIKRSLRQASKGQLRRIA